MSQIFKNFEQFGKTWGLVIILFTAFLTVALGPFGWVDIPIGTYAALGAFVFFGILFVWTIPPLQKFVKIFITIVIIMAAIGWGYFVYMQTAPHFDIAALDTLEGDTNAYEVTDQIIWNHEPDQLAAYGLSITFTLEIRPTYNGSQRLGKVVALVSGESGQTIERPLWDDFTSAASTQEIELSLADILRVSGLKTNSDFSGNLFQTNSIAFRQARLAVRIVRASDKAKPLASKELVIRNAPWDVRAELAWRKDQRQADVLVKNLGGTGEFALRCRLARLDNELNTNSDATVNGTTTLDSWFEPAKLVRLEPGASFTQTISIPEQTQPGRYLLEVYAIKKQNYAHFNDETTWQNLDKLQAPWWFGEYPSQRLLFVVPPKFEVNPIIQAELDRVKNERGVDLGLAIGPAEEVSSAAGTKGWRQTFRGGEVYLYNDQAYALYDPILTHFKELGGLASNMQGFPISPIQPVTSSLNLPGFKVEFEGQKSVIYESPKGVAQVQGWVKQQYFDAYGGHRGWLGFPLTDLQDYPDSNIQMFEHGYMVYYFPQTKDGRDWGRTPLAYPYFTGQGALFDVQAQSWQDTGVQVKSGDRVTIIQFNGTWTDREGVAPFDANGDGDVALQADALMPAELVGTLIGRIGESSEHQFSVGRWKEFTAPVEGNLYLAMNDNSYQHNAGFITVQIMVEPAK